MTFHKQLQNDILLYLDLDENVEDNFQNLMNFINNQNIKKDINEFRLFLHFINTISNYHYRTKNFLSKIEKILISFKDDFSNFLTNGEILDIFENNKIVLFLLIENGILIADRHFEEYIDDYDKEDYYSYFNNKINPDELLDNDFEKNQKSGENEQIICKYIRDDNISEFITYVVKKELSLDSTIKQSIFETNPFLLNKKTTLIEYSAFFGSIQIFTYLYKNKVKLTSSIWPYAIHGFNPEIIIILEENKISPEKDNYYEILEESIKCHHNDITSYIKENFLQKDLMIDEFIEFKSIKYYNFANFPIDLYQNRKQFYFYCKYDYFNFVEQYLKNKDIDINFQMNDSDNKYSYILTPLLVSVKNNHFNITKLLLDQPNIDLNFNVSCIDFKTNNETLNALIYAIMNNNPKIAKLFLDDDRFDVNNSLIIREYMDDNILKIDEYYPLHEAIICNNIEITKFLLQHQKIDVNAIQKITILNTFNKFVDKINEITVLEKAISKNNVKITKILLENRDIDVNKYSITKKDKKITKQTPLYSAILNENYKIIKLLLEHPKIDVNKKSIVERTTSFSKIDINENLPLKQAIDDENYEIIMLLLDNPNIDINQYFTSNNGNSEIKQTLLNYCIYNSKIEIVKLLLNHPNIDVNLPSFIKNNIEEKSITPLNMLIEKQNIDLIKLILSNKKIDVNKISNIINDNSKSQQTPLISAIKNVNDSDIVMCLLEHPNIDVNLYADQIINEDKKTKINPLLIATSLNLIEIAQYLFINQNLDVNAKYIIEEEKNIYEKNSLILAIENQNVNFVKLLASHNNIDINSKLVFKSKYYSQISETTILHLAIKTGNTEIIKNILQNPKIDINLSSFVTQNYEKYIEKVETPTICLSAFINFDDEVFRLLLSNENLNLNAKSKTTRIESTGFFVTEKTALQLVVETNNFTSFNFLFNFLRENKALNDNLNNLLKMASNIKIKSALYNEINKQS